MDVKGFSWQRHYMYPSFKKKNLGNKKEMWHINLMTVLLRFCRGIIKIATRRRFGRIFGSI